MTSDPNYWLLADLMNARKKDLENILLRMPDRGESCPGVGRGRTKAVMRNHIVASRAAFWDEKQKEKLARQGRGGAVPRVRTASRTSKAGRISAVEVNAYLRSLPIEEG